MLRLKQRKCNIVIKCTCRSNWARTWVKYPFIRLIFILTYLFLCCLSHSMQLCLVDDGTRCTYCSNFSTFYSSLWQRWCDLNDEVNVDTIKKDLSTLWLSTIQIHNNTYLWSPIMVHWTYVFMQNVLTLNMCDDSIWIYNIISRYTICVYMLY